jgi:hypothetical protein
MRKSIIKNNTHRAVEYVLSTAPIQEKNIKYLLVNNSGEVRLEILRLLATYVTYICTYNKVGNCMAKCILTY